MDVHTFIRQKVVSLTFESQEIQKLAEILDFAVQACGSDLGVGVGGCSSHVPALGSARLGSAQPCGDALPGCGLCPRAESPDIVPHSVESWGAGGGRPVPELWQCCSARRRAKPRRAPVAQAPRAVCASPECQTRARTQSCLPAP